MTCKIVKLIYTDLQRRGMGESVEDPIRVIEQWYDLKGNLVFEKDKWLIEKEKKENKDGK